MIRSFRLKGRFFIIAVILIGFNLFYVNGQSSGNVVQGVIRVKLKPEVITSSEGLSIQNKKSKVVTGLDKLDALNLKNGATQMRRVFPYSPKFEDRHIKYGLNLWYEISFSNDKEPKALLREYSSLPEVTISELIHIPVLIDGGNKPLSADPPAQMGNRTDQPPFNDPYLRKQWHYNNYGQTGGTPGSDIDLFEAWKTTHGKPDVIVAVMDQGVDYKHDDLKNMMWVNTAELNGTEGVDDDGNGYRDDIYGVNFSDFSGHINIDYHGTHVAGTIAAENNNGIGVCGIAGGSGNHDGVRIMTCQILGGSVGADIPTSYVYAADMGAVISQNSWGYNSPGEYDEAVHAGIDYFIAEAGNYPGSPMKGGIVLFASGNSNTELEMFPGAYPPVIAVDALDSRTNRAPYSNYGSWTDISAPGGNAEDDVVLSGEQGYSNGVLSTLNGNSYGYLDGTSMACPHVSGIAALVVSEFGGPNFTNENLKTHLLTGTQYLYNIPGNEALKGKLGTGYADAALALARDNAIAPQKITDLSLTGIAQDFATFSWTVPADEDDGKPYSFEILYSTKAITSNTISFARKIKLDNIKNAGEKQNIEIKNLLSVTQYYFSVRSIDRWGNTSDFSNMVLAKTNSGPVTSLDPSKSALNITINTTANPTGRDSIKLINSGEGLLRFEALTRLKSTTPLSVKPKLRYPSEPVILSAQNHLLSSPLTPSIFNNIQKDTLIDKGYVNVWVNLKVFGETNLQLPNSSATRFYVNEEEGFNLTNTDAYLQWDSKTGPVILEVYEGPDINTAKLLLAQEITEGSTGYTGAKLDEQLYFEKGSYFWLVYHVPAGNKFPLGGGLEMASEDSKNCYISFNVGKTWARFEDLYNDSRVVWAVYATSLNKNLDKFIQLSPDSGTVESNKYKFISAKVDGSNLVNGSYKSSLVLNINETGKPFVKVPVNVTVTGHKPVIKSIKRVDFGGVIIGKSKDIQVKFDNTGLGRFTFKSPYSTTTNNQFTYIGGQNTNFEAGTSQTLTFRFTPVTTGNNYCNVTLLDEKGNDYHFELFGAGLEPPKAEIHPTEVSYSNLALGDSIKGKVIINNTGKYPLDFYLPAFADGSNMETLPTNIQKFGYTFQIDTIGNSFVWQDIAATGTDITSNFKGNTMTNIYHHIDLNFLFPFYGKNENGVYISKYGVLAFVNNNSIWSSTPMNFKNGVNPTRYISACGFPMQFFEAGFGKVYYQKYADKLIVQYDDAPFWNGESSSDPLSWNPYKASITMQIILHDNGDIDMYYKSSSLSKNDAVYTMIAMEDASLDDGILIKGSKWKEWGTYYGTEFYYQANSAIHIKTPGLGLFSNLSHTFGTVLPGDSATLNYTIKTDSLSLLPYTENLVIVTNDPVNNPAIHKVHFTITSGGYSNIDVDKRSLDFDTLFVGSNESKTFNLFNDGKAIDSIVSASFKNNNYSLKGNIPDILKPDRKLSYLVSIKADTPGLKNDTLTLRSSNGKIIKIGISGFVTEGPVLSLQTTTGASLTSVTKFITAGNSATQNFKIQNQGAVNLEVAPISNEWAYISELASTPNKFNYKYKWKSSKDYGGPGYDWKEIAGMGGTKIEGLNSWEGPEWSQGIKLPFSFNFYGQNYDTIYIGANGPITFKKGQDDFGYFFGVGGIPIPGIPDNYIAPLFIFGGPDWIELYPLAGIYYKIESDRVIIEYRDFNSAFTMGDPISFEAILYKNGNIKFQYLMPVNTSNTVTDKGVIGIENQDGSDGVEISNNELYVNTDMSIMLYPVRTWSIAPGETKDFRINMSAAELVAGSYADSMAFESNDPYSLSKKLPVKLVVTGTPAISMPDSIDFGDILIRPEPESLISEFDLQNTGTDYFILSGLTQLFPDKVKLEVYHQVNGNWIWEKLTTGSSFFPYTLKAKKSLKMRVSILSGIPEIISENLEFNTSLSKPLHVLNVRAALYNPPVIQTSEDTIYYYASTPQFTKSHNLIVSNTGEYKLNYHADLAYMRDTSIRTSSMANDFAAVLSQGNTVLPSLASLKQVSGKKSGNVTGIFNRVLSYDNADTAIQRLGYGGARAIYIGTGFNAPSEGFNLTHVQTWFVPGDWLNSKIGVRILSGNDDINNCSLLYSEEFVHNISSVDEHGSLLTFELSKPVEFYPNEKFFIVFVYESGLSYPQGCVTLTNNVPRRFVFGDGEQYYDLSEYDQFSQLGWMTRAAEAQKSSAPWVILSSPDSGSVLPQGSNTMVFDFDAQNAHKGDNFATLSIHSNDVVNPEKKVVIRLRKNDGPQYFPENDLSVSENDTLLFSVIAVDLEGDLFTVNANEDPFVEIVSAKDTSYTYLGKSLPARLLNVRYTPDYTCQGLKSILFTGSDNFGNETSGSAKVFVKNINRAPEAIPLDTLYMRPYGDSKMIYPYDIFADPDFDIVTVSAVLDNPSVIDMFNSGNKYILMPLDRGRTHITFVATDAFGKTALNVLYIWNDENAAVSEQTEGSWKIYPNPAEDYLNLRLPKNANGELVLTLYNTLGTAVKIINIPSGQSSLQMNLSGIRSGLYLIRIKGPGVDYSAKFIRK
ncbi:MAG: S8 family serine peptidase [Bacteroidales bacterium]|nr:S8 family serine peptidase [Bacteroidales bacterium]